MEPRDFLNLALIALIALSGAILLKSVISYRSRHIIDKDIITVFYSLCYERCVELTVVWRCGKPTVDLPEKEAGGCNRFAVLEANGRVFGSSGRTWLPGAMRQK